MGFKFFVKGKKPASKNILHGHDLDKWHYLGWVELKLNEEEHPVFLFANKDDISKRSYMIVSAKADRVRKYHNYIPIYLEPWTKGEMDVYTLCRSPSRWLKEYMLDKFSCEWDKEKSWWKATSNAKYTSAQKKQAESNTPPNQGSGGEKPPVVIQVDFGKKDEN